MEFYKSILHTVFWKETFSVKPIKVLKRDASLKNIYIWRT